MKRRKYYQKHIKGRGQGSTRSSVNELKGLEKKLILKWPIPILNILNKIGNNGGKLKAETLNVNKYVLEGLYIHEFLEEKKGKLYLTEKGRRLLGSLPHELY